jgi:hypothetical protein
MVGWVDMAASVIRRAFLVEWRDMAALACTSKPACGAPVQPGRPVPVERSAVDSDECAALGGLVVERLAMGTTPVTCRTSLYATGH